jgi:hypothetical protein
MHDRGDSGQIVKSSSYCLSCGRKDIRVFEVKISIDMPLSLDLAFWLAGQGHDAVHVFKGEFLFKRYIFFHSQGPGAFHFF